MTTGPIALASPAAGLGTSEDGAQRIRDGVQGKNSTDGIVDTVTLEIQQQAGSAVAFPVAVGEEGDPHREETRLEE